MSTFVSSKCFAVVLVIFFLVLFLLQRFQMDDVFARGSTISADARDEVRPVDSDSFSVQGV